MSVDSAKTVEVGVAPEMSAVKVGLLPVLVSVVVAVLVSLASLAGVGLLLLRSGKLTLPHERSASPAPEKTAEAIAFPKHDVALEPLVVNLADANGKAYLRLGLTLRVLDQSTKEGVKAKEEKPKSGKESVEGEAAVRDVALEVLGRHTSEQMLAPGGKEELKGELKQAIAQQDPELKVAEIYLTEFLVQR